MTIGAPGTSPVGANAYDVTARLEFITPAIANVARLFINDEVMGLYLLTGALGAGIHSLWYQNGLTVLNTESPVFAANAKTFIGVVSLPTGTTPVAAGMIYEWATPKVPFQRRSGNTASSLSGSTTASSGIGLPDLLLNFRDDVAPKVPIQLVIKVSSTSASTDLYQWMVAGDTDFQTARQFNTLARCLAGTLTGSGLTSAASDCDTPLDRSLSTLNSYLTSTSVVSNRDDPQRQSINMLTLTWTAADDDARATCATTDATDWWYIQVGSVGINDSPECSDRGVCDYSSGVCKCFKGYAGIDCAMQNALATGGSATSA
jgi:hypothetical protein